MNKKKTIITLVLLMIIGAALNFFFTNMVMSGISHKDSFNFLIKLSAGFPGLFFNIEIIALIFFIYRWYLRPTQTKRMLFVYGIEEAIFGLLGIASTIFTCLVFYKSFVKPYPVPLFHIAMLIWHFLVMALGILSAFKIGPSLKKKDEIKYKLNAKGVFLTIGLSLVYYFALNRLGALMFAPMYISLWSLHKTFTFYVALLFPIAFIFNAFLYIFKVYEKNKKRAKVGMIVSIIFTALTVIDFTAIILIGVNDTAYISAISPAVPIERLMTLPIDIVLHLACCLLLGGISIYKGAKYFLAFSDKPKAHKETKVKAKAKTAK